MIQVENIGGEEPANPLLEHFTLTPGAGYVCKACGASVHYSDDAVKHRDWHTDLEQRLVER
jgi:hypothetical protein